jgi:hypothetical protein
MPAIMRQIFAPLRAGLSELTLFTATQTPTPSYSSQLYLQQHARRHFSVLNRPPPNYPGHVPLTFLERGALAIGSAFGSLIDPYRAGGMPFSFLSWSFF